MKKKLDANGLGEPAVYSVVHNTVEVLYLTVTRDNLNQIVVIFVSF